MTPAERPAVAPILYAAFLWWVAVISVQALLDLVGTGMYLGLLYNGAAATTLFTFTAGQQALSLMFLWVGFAAALRPGALEPSPLARHGGVLAGALLMMFGSLVVAIVMPAMRFSLFAQEAVLEDIAMIAQAQQYMLGVHHVVLALTYALVMGLLWLRVNNQGEA